MLTDQEYKELEPYKNEIKKFIDTGNYSGAGLSAINVIRQHHNMGTICFDCDGSKAEAVKDAWNLLVEYEKNNEIKEQ